MSGRGAHCGATAVAAAQGLHGHIQALGADHICGWQRLAEGEGGHWEGALEHLVPQNGGQLATPGQQQAGGCCAIESLHADVITKSNVSAPFQVTCQEDRFACIANDDIVKISRALGPATCHEAGS